MQKQKSYRSTFFSVEILQTAVRTLTEICPDSEIKYTRLGVRNGEVEWIHDHISEFWADYRDTKGSSTFNVEIKGSKSMELSLMTFARPLPFASIVTVKGDSRDKIETVFDLFDRSENESKLPDLAVENTEKIFVGHGRSPLWRELKDHLQDDQKFVVEAYEIGARAGHAVRDILESMLQSSSMAFLIMTGEDEMEGDTLRPRQNVVHELGLFQGKLGFSKSIAVVEQGVEIFSNLQGIQQIRFSRGNIKESFGEIVATIRRENDYA